TGVLVDGELFADGGEGTLWASLSFADLAAHPDRCGSVLVIEIQSRRVHQPVCVPQFATQSHGEHLPRAVVAADVALHGPGDPEVGLTVRHARHLGQDLAGCGERLVDVPQGA